MAARDLSTDDILDALGSPTRRKILGILGEGEKSVGVIAQLLPVSRPAVSRHLRQLQEARLVTYDDLGAHNVYRLDRTGFDAARGWLDRFWDDALSRFALVAENTAPKKVPTEVTKQIPDPSDGVAKTAKKPKRRGPVPALALVPKTAKAKKRKARTLVPELALAGKSDRARRAVKRRKPRKESTP